MLGRDDYADALRAIPADICRDEWIQAGMGARAAGLTEDDFLQWSEPASSFSERDAKAVWRSFNGNGVTAGTLVHIAKRYGWEPPKRVFTAQEVWDAGQPATDAHPYVRKKNGTPEGLRVLPHDHPLRINGVECGGALLVPARSPDGTLRTVQAITSQKKNLGGHTFEDSMFIVGQVESDAPIYVAEGVATAWACWRATGRASAVSFGVGRFKRVARTLQERFPACSVVLVPDRGVEAQVAAVASALSLRMVTLPQEMPDKADAADYAELHGDDVLDQLLSGAAAPADPQPIPSLPASATHGPVEVDLGALSLIEPQRPQFLLPVIGALPFGEPTLLAAHGGGSKSTLATQLVVCMSAGVSFMGEPAMPLRCALISFEDPAPVLHWRLRRSCHAAGVTMADTLPRLRIFDGTTWAGAWYARKSDGTYGLTPDFEAMRERVKDVDLIVVDGAADVYAGNENDRAQVKQFVRGLRTMVPPHGALLLLAHVDKAGSREGGSAEGYSGSTGWHNSVRSRLFMYRETTEDEGGAQETGCIVLEVKKSNYGKAHGRMTLRYDEEYDCLRRVDRAPVEGEKADEADGVLKVVRIAYDTGNPIPAATGGPRTAHKVAASYGELPASLKGQRGRARFNSIVERLRSSGRLSVEPYTKANRHRIEVLRAAF